MPCAAGRPTPDGLLSRVGFRSRVPLSLIAFLSAAFGRWLRVFAPKPVAGAMNEDVLQRRLAYA